MSRQTHQAPLVLTARFPEHSGERITREVPERLCTVVIVLFKLRNSHYRSYLTRKKDQGTEGWASLIAQPVKNPPAMQETPVRFLGQEDPLEKR